MKTIPNSANVVILAANYNPSIVSKDWLSQKEIFTDPPKNFVHTPVLSLVEGDQFGFTLDQSRLQFTVKKVTEESLAAMSSAPLRFVKALPETPFRALGFNYEFIVSKSKCHLNAVISPNDAKLRELLGDKYELGAMVAFTFEEFFTTLTIIPSLNGDDQIRIAFNFHSKVNGASEAEHRLSMHQKTIEKASSIVGGVCDA